MIRHPIIEAIIDQRIGNVDSSSEDLVKVSSILMGDCAWVESASEVEDVEIAIHMVDVVVEVTTHHDCSIRILPQDIFDYIRQNQQLQFF
jgi:predicted small metal-binding protein